VVPSVKGLPVPTGTMGAHYISPRMRARMDDLGLREADISAVAGTGAGGRVTVEDLERFLDYLEAWPSTQASPMRLAVADAMRRSWTRPLATVGFPPCSTACWTTAATTRRNPASRSISCAPSPSPRREPHHRRLSHRRQDRASALARHRRGRADRGRRGGPRGSKTRPETAARPHDEYDDLVDRARRRRLTEDGLQRRDRHRHQLRHLRPDPRHADSAAERNPHPRHRRGREKTGLEPAGGGFCPPPWPISSSPSTTASSMAAALACCSAGWRNSSSDLRICEHSVRVRILPKISHSPPVSLGASHEPRRLHHGHARDS
jgi:hypothetical protein